MSHLSERSRKRVSLSPPSSSTSKHTEDAIYHRLLQTAGIDGVTDHIPSIGPTRPSASELLVLDRALPSVQSSSVRDAMVTRLLSTISELDTAESRIRQASIKAQKLWRALDPSVSPISKLPDDLLVLIFEHGVQREVAELLAPPKRSNDIPKQLVEEATLDPSVPFSVPISHVCQNWRALALQRSSLWTIVRPDWAPEQLMAWLARSKTRGLHIDMTNISCRICQYRQDLLRDVLNRWASVCISIQCLPFNWREMDIDDLLADYTKFLFGVGPASNGAPSPIPALKHLSIATTLSVQLSHNSATVPLLPRLETLLLDNTTIDSLDEFFPAVMYATIDLSGLFSYQWSGISVAHRLRSLTLRSHPSAPDEEDEPEASAAPWSLPTLKHLCIDSIPYGVCQSLLRLLRAPNLDSFHVNLRGKDRRTKQAILQFARSHPSITSVQLFGSPSDSLGILCPPPPSVDSLQQLSTAPTDTSISISITTSVSTNDSTDAGPSASSSSASISSPVVPPLPFPHLQRLTIGKMHFVSLDLNEVRLFRHFFLSREEESRRLPPSQSQSLSTSTSKSISDAPSYSKIQLLRLDERILADLKSMDMSQDSVTQVEDWEDDEDYDEAAQDEAMTDADADADAGTEFEDAFDEVDVDVAADEEGGDVDELEDEDIDGEDSGDDESDGSDSDSQSEFDEIEGDEEDAEVEIELQASDDTEPDLSSEPTLDLDNNPPNLTVPSSKSAVEEDELASLTSDDDVEDFERWVLQHVEVLESIKYDWNEENP